MASLKCITSVLMIFIYSAHANTLPNFIKPCSGTDPKLLECAIKHGQQALPHIAKGYKAFNHPNMSPLKLPLIKVESNPNLTLSFKDVVITGFDDMELAGIDMDLAKMTSKLTIHTKELKLEGTYDINGQILGKAITGIGPAHIKFVDTDFIFSISWEMYVKDGLYYSKLKDENMEWSSSRNYYVLDNLFNGDKTSGNEMNKFLDENWKEVDKIIGPVISDTMEKISYDLMRALGANVPYSEIFLT